MSESQPEFATISDDPIDSAVLFGFSEKADELVNFLISKKTTTPFVIAIDGEWGSGKSSLLLTTQRKLEEKMKKDSASLKVIYFDAWAYESTNPAAALVYEMLKPLQSAKISNAKGAAMLALDVVARHTLNMSMGEIKQHFDHSIDGAKALDNEIKKAFDSSLPNGRLVILIDDLDRCTIENTLAILDSIKLFLAIERCLFVIAVDMPKVELAWKSRYGNDKQILEEGISYLEKIFQMRIAVPPKKKDEIKKFIKNINENISDDIAELITLAGPRNLRKIKRLLNLALFRASAGKSQVKKFELSIIWSLFERLVKNNKKAIKFFDLLPKETGHNFLKYINEIIPIDDDVTYTQHLVQNTAFQKIGGVPSFNDQIMRDYFKQVRWILQGYGDITYDALEMSLKEIVSASEEAT